MQALENIRTLSTEVTEMGRKLEYLNRQNAEKGDQINELIAKNNQLEARHSGDREQRVKLVDVKSMAPKPYTGGGGEGFKVWSTKGQSVL